MMQVKPKQAECTISGDGGKLGDISDGMLSEDFFSGLTVFGC